MSTKARLQRLRAEVASDRAAAEGRLREVSGLQLDERADPGTLAQAAVALHHAYGAIEALLIRVGRTLGEGEPTDSEWHRALIHSMTLDIEEVRPAVLSEESSRLLGRLLGFRHFFRHAYSVTLDWEQLALLQRDARKLLPHLGSDLDQLDAFLIRLVEQASS